MEKILTVNIDDLDMNGLGIAHYNDKIIFIDNSLPGEIVNCDIYKEKNNICFAKNLKIVKMSDERITPACPYFNLCGGCDLQHLDYQKSLVFKKNQIKIALKKIANIPIDDFEVVDSNNKYFYRNKIAMPIRDISGDKALCLFKKSSHEAIKISSCKIMDKQFDEVIKFVNDYLKICKLSAYSDNTKKGILKHFVCRIINNDILITFVLTKKEELNDIEILYNNLVANFKAVSINININKTDKDILSNNFVHIIGEKYIYLNEFNIIQPITNASFLQVNFDIQNKIYQFVLNNIKGNIVNAYSGTGLLSCILAKNNISNKIFGIEINKEASKLANILKQNNNIPNLENHCGDAGTILNKLDLINYNLVVDPPRSGLDNKMIRIIKENKPGKIIYISCDKISLAKNLKELLSLYNLQSLTAFDMFPQTAHIETVTILTKKRD